MGIIIQAFCMKSMAITYNREIVDKSSICVNTSIATS